MGFNFIYGKPEAGIELFKQLNVPILAPVYSSNLAEWEESFSGITSEVYWQIAYPELDGRIEPVFMGGSKLIKIDERTGAILEKKMPLPDRIERLSGRALAWINLRKKDNGEKKVALIYYNHHAGKDDIGASYLNVFESAAQILKALREDGYKVDGDLSARAIEEMIRKKGRNVGSWAPGELAALVEAGALTLPVDKYLSWYQTLPEKMRAAVEKEWGPPPGEIMVYNGKFVIPGALLDNVFIGAQPVRGWGDDPAKITHSPELVPHHQYLAFYLWLQNEFGADAVIHLGTHGTLEWLPRRSVGLGEDDWPDLLIGNMPDIYPYIMNNPGEATQAKRRGYAVIIDHLTPPMIQPGLYGELIELQQQVVEYQEAVNKNETGRAEALKEQIIQKVKASNIDQDLGVELESIEFSKVVAMLHEYLEELAGELMPYGLHTFGLPPQGEMLSLFTDAIIDFDKEAREGSRAEIQEKLLLTGQEIKNLLLSLRGEYIEPGLGRDPVRIPAALPTGRNLVTFDPRMVPDQIAWNIGKQAADQLLAKFYAAQGRYPETIGVVLWAIETMRTQGETVALILRLIGTEPVWDKMGRVNSVKVTPLAELGRPRINVLVTISGLFRDTFAHITGVIDDAFRQVALLDEDQQKNLVRKTYLSLKDQLIEKGFTEKDADFLAMSRIFGDAPGTYGTGVAELAQATAAWQSPEELANTYIERMAFIYGRDTFGLQATSTFKEILKSVETVVQVRDSLYGVLDNDDVAQYLGGLMLAAKTISGKNVYAYIVNSRSGVPQVQTLEHFVGTELRTRLLNPKWIEGMLKEGFAGFRTISEHVANMFLMDATTESITNWDWQQVAKTYIFNEEIRRQLDPFAAQSIIGWALEAARRQLWQADEQTIRQLSDTYIQMAAQYGVVCCHHTCANIVFNEWVANYSTLDQDTLSKFQNVFNQATQKNLSLPNRQAVTPSKNSTSSRREEPPAPLVPETQQAEDKRPKEQESEKELSKPEETIKQPLSGEQEAPEENAGAAVPGQLASAPSVQETPGQLARETSEKETSSGAGPQQAVKIQPEEQTGEPSKKAYEVKIKDKLATGSRKAVTVFAIIAALGIAAFLAKGYFSRPR
jgi:cobaltochelatase CobN